MVARVYPISQPSSACFHASRFTSARDSVSGMPLGQACTQFWALAQSSMPPLPIEGLDAFFGVHRAGGMHVEEAHLADDRGAHELAVVVYLRADLEAAAAGDATRKRIAPFPADFGRDRRGPSPRS